MGCWESLLLPLFFSFLSFSFSSLFSIFSADAAALEWRGIECPRTGWPPLWSLRHTAQMPKPVCVCVCVIERAFSYQLKVIAVQLWAFKKKKKKKKGVVSNVLSVIPQRGDRPTWPSVHWLMYHWQWKGGTVSYCDARKGEGIESYLRTKRVTLFRVIRANGNMGLCQNG